MKRVLLPLLLLLAVPAAAQEPGCSGLFTGGVPPMLVNPKLERRTTPLCNAAYAVLESGMTHGPLWSAEHPTRASIEDARQLRREGEFRPDDRLPAEDRAQLGDYRGSGYDRGHMVPSGDMPTAEAQNQSFLLSNVVPQTAELNRGIWAGVEQAVRGLAERDGELFVVTGPVFRGEALQSIGADGVLVPTSTWKAVFDPVAGGAGAYVCRNDRRPSCETMSVAALTQLVGIDPFRSLPLAVKQTTLRLPPPERSPYGSGRHRHTRRRESLLDLLLGG